tara:strand:+ start:1364 stop:1702 length:339 start_codon:yes stop_codon:yes gene_type:complete
MNYFEDDDELDKDFEKFFEKFDEEIHSIVQDEKIKIAFIDWVQFLVTSERQLRYGKKMDKYKTRDFFAGHGIEMTPDQVKELMVNVNNILDALDYFRGRNTNYDDDTGLDSE